MESLILLTGPDGIGKDFFFKNKDKLNDYYTFNPSFSLINPNEYVRIALADPIKLSLCPTIKDITASGLKREDIISHANEMKKMFNDEDIFVKLVISKIKRENIPFVIITDLRFINEYEMLKDNFSCIKIIVIENNFYNLPFDIIALKKK